MTIVTIVAILNLPWFNIKFPVQGTTIAPGMWQTPGHYTSITPYCSKGSAKGPPTTTTTRRGDGSGHIPGDFAHWVVFVDDFTMVTQVWQMVKDMSNIRYQHVG